RSPSSGRDGDSPRLPERMCRCCPSEAPRLPQYQVTGKYGAGASFLTPDERKLAANRLATKRRKAKASRALRPVGLIGRGKGSRTDLRGIGFGSPSDLLGQIVVPLHEARRALEQPEHVVGD